MRLYLDTNAIISAVEARPVFREGVVHWVEQAEATAGLLISSRLARLECLVLPVRDKNQPLIAAYDGFFARDNLVFFDVSGDVLERATDVCARFRVRTPDAIHLATAILVEADVFLTSDDKLKRCTDVNVVVLAGPKA
jgi:predicted nucleic acid-binding protein